MSSTAELVATIHAVSIRAAEANKDMTDLYKNESIPTQERLKFLNAQSVIEIQDMLVRRLTEMMLSQEDRIDSWISKLEEDK